MAEIGIGVFLSELVSKQDRKYIIERKLLCTDWGWIGIGIWIRDVSTGAEVDDPSEDWIWKEICSRTLPWEVVT